MTTKTTNTIIENIQILVATAIIWVSGVLSYDLHFILKNAEHMCYNDFMLYVVPSFLFASVTFLMIMLVINRVNARKKE